MRAIEHIGIAVEDIDKAEITYAKLLGVSSYKREKVESEGVITSFFKVGDVKIVDGLGPNGVAWLTLKGGKFASRVQSGFLYHYAFVMMIGLLVEKP